MALAPAKGRNYHTGERALGVLQRKELRVGRYYGPVPWIAAKGNQPAFSECQFADNVPDDSGAPELIATRFA